MHRADNECSSNWRQWSTRKQIWYKTRVNRLLENWMSSDENCSAPSLTRAQSLLYPRALHRHSFFRHLYNFFFRFSFSQSVPFFFFCCWSFYWIIIFDSFFQFFFSFLAIPNLFYPVSLSLNYPSRFLITFLPYFCLIFHPSKNSFFSFLCFLCFFLYIYNFLIHLLFIRTL